MNTLGRNEMDPSSAGLTILRVGLLVGLSVVQVVPGQALASQVQGQGPDDVVELQGDEITPERLIEVLAPKTRGLGVPKPITSSRPPQCKLVRQRLTRGIKVEQVATGLSVPIHFAFNSARIEPEEIPTLDKIGAAVSDPRLASFCLLIEGHTDGIGSDRFNDRLSQRRAEAVVGFLVGRFRIQPQRLMAVGRGKRNPLADNDSDAGRLRNRRVQIKNLGGDEEEP
jgi:outer membrane protein OmpA-like peptidoglycan-associated protein